MSADIPSWVKHPERKMPTSTAVKIFLTVLTAPTVAACSTSNINDPGFYNFNNIASENPASPVNDLFTSVTKSQEIIQKGPDERDFWRAGHFRLKSSYAQEMGDLTILTNEHIDRLTAPDGYFLRGFLQRTDGKPLRIRNIKITVADKEFGREHLAPEDYSLAAVNIGFDTGSVIIFDSGIWKDTRQGVKLYLAQVSGDNFKIMPESRRIYQTLPTNK